MSHGRDHASEVTGLNFLWKTTSQIWSCLLATFPLALSLTTKFARLFQSLYQTEKYRSVLYGEFEFTSYDSMMAFQHYLYVLHNFFSVQL